MGQKATKSQKAGALKSGPSVGESLGKSTLGQDLVLHRFRGPSKRCLKLLLIGGVHGDEPEGYGLVGEILRQAESKKPVDYEKVELLILPRLNPDGCVLNSRRNGRLVDLNRNLPTKDWSPQVATPRYYPGPFAGSEIENQILMKLIESEKPSAIVSAHSWNPMINYNGPCARWAKAYGDWVGCAVSDDIGYPTPGSLGTWAGWERDIPTITLEIERGMPPENMAELHSVAFWKAFGFLADQGLEGLR